MVVEMELGEWSILINGVKEYRQVIMSVQEERLTLPVTPSKYSVTTAQNNKIVDILDFGENVIFANTKVKRLKFDALLPALMHEYPFVVGDKKEPSEIIDLITKWQTNKSPVRVIITDSPINMQMALVGIKYHEKDGTRDIYASFDLAEYRDWNIPNANYRKQIDNETGLKSRTDNLTNELRSKLIRNALDIVDKSKMAYGDYNSLGSFKVANGISGLSIGSISGWKW